MEIINVTFEEHEVELKELLAHYNTIGQDALFYTHYDLAMVIPDTSISDWRMFLTDPRVQQALETELLLAEQNALHKIIKDIDKDKSPGKAQIVNALMSHSTQGKKKEGPAFIYTYIPLNEEEHYAPGIQVAQSDPFKVND